MERKEESGNDLVKEQSADIEHAPPDYSEQGAHGYDLSLFRANLRWTPTERIERLQQALVGYLEVNVPEQSIDFRAAILRLIDGEVRFV